MGIFILIAVIVLVVWYLKNKANNSNAQESYQPEPYVHIDPATLPNTISELRAAISDDQSRSHNYACYRKISELGFDLFMQRKLIGKQGDEYDINAMIRDIKEALNFSYADADQEFKFRCYSYGAAMGEYIAKLYEADPSVYYDMEPVTHFCSSAWYMLPGYYNDGEVTTRNTFLARRFLRMKMAAALKIRQTVDLYDVLRLMEMPQPDKSGIEEINKWLAIKFAMDQMNIYSGKAVRNFFAATIQQAANLLYQMDLQRINSPDISVMLDEYRRAAEAGNAYAQYKLGEFYYEYGRFTGKDREKGLALILQAAENGLYLAVRKASDHYDKLSRPFDDAGVTKAQLREHENTSYKWSHRCDEISYQLESLYGIDFYAHYLPSLRGGSGRISYSVPTAYEEPAEEEAYVGSSGDTDRESPFTILDLPDEIKDVHGNIYHKTNVSADYAEYHCDNGCNTTIHLSDIHVGITGFSAKNSDGYFSW